MAHGIAVQLYPVAFRILRDHDRADDATQQAIVRIWRDLPSLRDVARFDAWAYRILVNACRDEIKRADRGREIPGFGTEPMAPDDALQYYLDLGLPEIADILGVPLGTVKSRSHAARQAMRAALEADARTLEGVQPV
jgi:RNA polymerase sigma-70 factor (ECF subfamily)